MFLECCNTVIYKLIRCEYDSKLVPLDLISDVGAPKNHVTAASGQGYPT